MATLAATEVATAPARCSGGAAGGARRQASGHRRAAAEAAAAAAAEAAAAAAADAAAPAGVALRRLHASVGADADGQRVSKWIRTAFAAELGSKSQAAAAIAEGRLLLGGAPVEGSRVLRSGDELTLLHDDAAAARLRAGGHAHAPLRLVHADAHVAVVWKPVGVRALGEWSGTMQAALPLLLAAAAPADDGAAPRPVSRLEIGCSGLSVVARGQPWRAHNSTRSTRRARSGTRLLRSSTAAPRRLSPRAPPMAAPSTSRRRRAAAAAGGRAARGRRS